MHVKHLMQQSATILMKLTSVRFEVRFLALKVEEADPILSTPTVIDSFRAIDPLKNPKKIPRLGGQYSHLVNTWPALRASREARGLFP